MKLSGTALIINPIDKIGDWKKVLICDYDPKTEKFSIETDDRDKIKYQLQKIYINFDAEDPFKHAQRVLMALKRREAAFNKIKYNHILKKIPNYSVSQFPETLKNNIVLKTQNIKDINMVYNVLEDELKQITLDYIQTINKMTFDDLFFNKKSTDLNVGNLHLEKTSKEPVPYFAQEHPYQIDFEEINKAFNIKYLFTKKNIITTINKIKLINSGMFKQLSLFYINENKSIKVEEYKKEQRRQIMKFKQDVELDKIQEIKKILKAICIENDENNFEIDFILQKVEKRRKLVFEEDRKKEKYIENLMKKINEVKTSNFLNLVNTITRDALFELICQSLFDFVSFFEKHIPSLTRIIDINTVINQYSNTSTITNISQIIIDLPKPNPFNKPNNESLDTTDDIIEKDNLIEITQKSPIFYIYLYYKDSSFNFSVKIDDLVSEIRKIFDEGIEKTQKISKIFFSEKQFIYSQNRFFNLLKRDKMNLTSSNGFMQGNLVKTIGLDRDYNQEITEWVGQLYNRLGEVLLTARDPLMQFQAQFNKFKDYLDLNPEIYVKQFEERTKDVNGIKTIKEDIEKFIYLKNEIKKEIKDEIHVSYFNVNCKEIRENLLLIFDKIIEMEENLLIVKTRDIKNSVFKQVEEIKKEISKNCKTLEELNNLEKFIEDIPSILQKLQSEIDTGMSIYKILDELQYKNSFNELRMRWLLVASTTDILNSIGTVQGILIKQRKKFQEEA